MRTVAEAIAGKGAVVQINTVENPALASRFAVRSVPLIILLKGGRQVAQLAGARPAESLLAWFMQHK